MKNFRLPNIGSLFIALKITALSFLVFGCNQLLGPLNTVGLEGLRGKATEIILAGLADDDPRIRANAIEVAASAHQSRFMPEVQLLLNDDILPVRFAAILAVADTKYQPAARNIDRLLKDRDGNIRIAAVYAMKKLGQPANFGIIGEAITSSDQTLRANAALLLGKSGDQSVLKVLKWALYDENSDHKVRFQAVEAMARLGDKKVFPKLWTMLISIYADDRVMGIKAMGALGGVQAKDVLITKLDDDVLEVRLHAAEQLGALGDTSGEAVVLEVFGKKLTSGLDDKEIERIHTLAALAIGRIGTAPLTKFLPRLLKNDSKYVRIAAAKAVFQCLNRN